MTQDFEKWLAANKHLINVDAVGLFEDSLRCFKNDIDRPSYLLAYQGMMLQIREVIKAGNMPDGFPLNDWIQLQKGLNDSNIWDNTCFDAVVRQEQKHGAKTVPAVLCLPANVRKEFEHWRNLRNICAHYKDYCFVKAHTLTLYSFIVQYLLSITVEGGMMTLLNEFKTFFDPVKTPPNKSWQPLIDKVHTMVRPDEMQTFLHGIRRLIYLDSDKIVLFLHELYQTNKLDIKDAVTLFINNDDDLRQTYISKYPQSVATLLTKDEVYEFAKRRVPYMRDCAAVMSAIVQTGMVDKENYEELFDNLIELAQKHDFYIGELTQVDKITLDNAGFFSFIMREYLNAGYMSKYQNYQDVNYSMRFWTSVFWLMPINKEFVKAVCEVFCASFKPLALENFVCDEYLKDNEIHDKFFEIAEKEGYTIPDVFLK